MRENTNRLGSSWLGALAHLGGYVTWEDIESCLEEQAESESKVRLGEIFLRRGHLTEGQLRGLFAIQKGRLACARRAEPPSPYEGRFNRLVDMKRLSRSGDAHQCLRLHRDLREEHTMLGEILLLKAWRRAAREARALSAEGRRVLLCDRCYARQEVEFDECLLDVGEDLVCVCHVCGGDLREPRAIA